MKTNYDLIIEGIHALNIDTVFVYPGHGIIPLLDKINEDQTLRMVVCSCEQEAVTAADAYGRYKGAGVAIVTYGVGALSTLNQVGNAVISRSPLWIISGRSSAKERSGKFVWSTVGDINAYINIFSSIGCKSYEFTTIYDSLGYVLQQMKNMGKPFYMEIDPETGSKQTELTLSPISPIMARSCDKERFTYWIQDELVNYALPGSLNLDGVPNQICEVGKTYITYDVGEASFAASQLVEHFRMSNSSFNDILGPLPWASMGFALPAAIGVALAKHQPVIAITGDGSLRLSLFSLATIWRYQLPIKIILIDNDGFETERVLSEAAQTAAYNELTELNYRIILEEFGIPVYDNLYEMLTHPSRGAHIIECIGPSPRMKEFSEVNIRSVIE